MIALTALSDAPTVRRYMNTHDSVYATVWAAYRLAGNTPEESTRAALAAADEAVAHRQHQRPSVVESSDPARASGPAAVSTPVAAASTANPSALEAFIRDTLRVKEWVEYNDSASANDWVDQLKAKFGISLG